MVWLLCQKSLRRNCLHALRDISAKIRNPKLETLLRPCCLRKVKTWRQVGLADLFSVRCKRATLLVDGPVPTRSS